MLNLQTTASSKNEQSAIQSATQKKKEGGNGDFLGALLASLSKDTSHTSSNVSNENKTPQSTSNTQSTQSNTSQNSPQAEFGEQSSQTINQNSNEEAISQNSSEEAINQNSSEQAISDATLKAEEGKSATLSELSASKGDVSTENVLEQEAINDEGFMQVLSVLEGIFGGEAPNIAKISSSLEKLISIEENLAQLKDVKDLKDLLKIAEKLKLGLEKLSITSEALGTLKSKFPALDKANFFKPIDISLNQAALSAKNAKPAQPVVLASLLGKTAPKSITQVLKEAELEAPKTSKTAPKESGLKGLLNGDDIKTKAPKQSANEIVEKVQNKVEPKSAATEKDLLKISEKSTKEPKITPSPLPSAPKVAKSEVNELKAFDIQNYLNSISKKAASETTSPSTAGTLANIQSEPSGESHPSFGDAIENRLSDNNFKDMIAALKMQDKIISRDIQQNSVRSFAAQMVEKISEFKPPVTRVNLQLHPAELGEVNITMIARANNLHVNVTSANATMALFLQNQAEFKANLVNMGFSDIQMSFSDHKEGSNTQQNANKAKKSYESDEDGVMINEFEGSGESTLEIVLPRYI
ncbi:MAG: flagellar hook-length control protein FliK [Campylobacter sp.]|uniref:flagellar hook-length control protein FliK n=1 Tax=Campylobacter sp. TaxID=205 RepID=UPI002A828068|nr:flagellar hook-length control protein FliK [Campylobacter sp.]MDY5116050.1 flagellar hook-length control protein FliK [Campylobacter sp.]